VAVVVAAAAVVGGQQLQWWRHHHLLLLSLHEDVTLLNPEDVSFSCFVSVDEF